MESAKLVTAGWLARRWSPTAKLWRAALVMFVFGLAVINAAGVFAQLVSAHVGERGEATSRVEEQTADLDARIDVQSHKVTDLDRGLGQIDGMSEEATRRGRTKAAIEAMKSQRRARAALGEERNREAAALAAMKAERALATAHGCQIETEAAPIRYVASIFGVIDPEDRHPLADRLDGAVLRSSRDRIDGRGVGKAVNCRLNNIGPKYLRYLPCRSDLRLTAVKGQKAT